jgi:hypothetical protein
MQVSLTGLLFSQMTVQVIKKSCKDIRVKSHLRDRSRQQFIHGLAVGSQYSAKRPSEVGRHRKCLIGQDLAETLEHVRFRSSVAC